MNFLSFRFYIFLFVLICTYYCAPVIFRKYILLGANIFFLLSFNIFTLFIMAVSVTISFFAAKAIDKYDRYKKIVFFLAVSTILILLIASRLVKGQDHFYIAGISFWGLQVLGYLCDVYTQRYRAENNFADYFVYVSFFANLTSGPIENEKNFIPQLKKLDLTLSGIQHGFQIFLWGMMIKLVLGERLALIVNTVYGDLSLYSGLEVLIAVLAYTMQIYCDFYGYSCMAVGLGQIFGITLLQNFEQPYFSKTIAEFWHRWHVSLSGWLKNYIYIPLGGNKKGTVRKYINLSAVFVISALWHGFAMHYIVWGGVHAVYQIVSDFTADFRTAFKKRLHVNEKAVSYSLWEMICTFVLTSFAWIFFRAASVKEAFWIIKKMLLGFDLSVSFGKTIIQSARHMAIGKQLVSEFDRQFFDHCGMEGMDLKIMWISIMVLILIDFLHWKKYKIREWIDRQNLFFRWGIYLGAVFIIIVFGLYGGKYNASGFIYSEF